MNNSPKKCWICGKPAVRALKDRKTNLSEQDIESVYELGVPRNFCQSCYEKHSKKIRGIEEEYGKLKKTLMLERAIKILEDQQVNLYELKDIIDQFQDYVVENPEKFDSSDEMIVAMFLVASGIKAKMQYSIDNYKVDFYIPSLKVVLEVDGYLHQYKTYKDNKRDIKIRSILGNDWEIVRIPTKYIEANAKQIVPAILSIKAEKQKIRKSNNGIIPEWYSKRTAATKKVGLNGEQHLIDI